MVQSQVLMATCSLFLLLLPTAACHALNSDGTSVGGHDGGEPPPSWVVPCVGTALAVASIVLALGCVCCRDDGLKMLGVQNGIQVPHLPMSNVLAPTSDELTIFPPPASQLVLMSQPSHEDKVRFEPLPKIFPRGGAVPSKRAGILRPAHYSGELGARASSVHDWFDDPQANFPRQQLQYLQELGTGWFGQAVRGEAHNLGPAGVGTSPVVVKILRTDATPTEHLCFLHEVQPYRVLRHPNVLRLLGRCLESDPFLVILEDSAMDLKSFLVQRKSNADTFFASGAPLHIACAITAGLQHMHRYNFVHVDLAARNCIITRDQSVKVGDYGTSIQAYKEDYYVVGEVAIPIRWSAPESIHCTEIALEAREVTKEANVWSLGVVLWELMTLCATPYSNLSDEEVLQRVIMQRRLILEKPKIASPHLDRLYQVMTWCWNDPLERPTVQEIAGLLIHLRDHSERDLDMADFESRWRSLRPVMFREHNLAPGHPATRQVSHLGFESDFAPLSETSASLRNLRGSIEDLNREEEELTSMQISEAIQGLDAILAAESSSSTESKSDVPPIGNDSLCSLESKENSLGFKKSASVEDLLKEGPEKVAQLFRITVIDDDDVSDPRTPSSTTDDSARRIWSSAGTPWTTGREADASAGANGAAIAEKITSEERDANAWENSNAEGREVRSIVLGNPVLARPLEEPATQGVADVSSRMPGGLPGDGKPSSRSCCSPSPANTTAARITNGRPASCVESVAALAPNGLFGSGTLESGGHVCPSTSVNLELVKDVSKCNEENCSPEPGSRARNPAGGNGSSGDQSGPHCVCVLDFSRSSEESSSSPRTGEVAVSSSEMCTTRDSSGNSALYVTAMDTELSEGSILSTTDISLVEDFSESVASYVTARPEDGDDTSECSEATLAEDDDRCGVGDLVQCDVETSMLPPWSATEGSPESSLVSDATLDDVPRRKLLVEYDNSPDVSDSSLMEKIERMQGIVNKVVAQQNGFLGRKCPGLNGDVVGLDGCVSRKGGWERGPVFEEDSRGTDQSDERNSDDSGRGEYELDDISDVLDNEEEPSDKLPPRLMSAPAPELDEEDEIITVNMVTNEITVRPANVARLVLDGEEVLAGVTPGADDVSDTDDTSSTGTSASTTSGSFECLTLDQGKEMAEQPHGNNVERVATGVMSSSATWDRSATPTKGVLKSSLCDHKGHSSSLPSNLRKSVSFNDVIRSVYHYLPTDDDEPLSPPPRVHSANLDYSSFQDWDFQSSLEDEDLVEEMESSDDDALHLHCGRTRARPLAASTVGPLYSISGLSQEDLCAEADPSSADGDHSMEDGRCSPHCLLSDERPPWDSMSDLSCLDGTSDDGLGDLGEPVGASTPTYDEKGPATTTEIRGRRTENRNLHDTNANVEAFVKAVPSLYDEVNSNRASGNSLETSS